MLQSNAPLQPREVRASAGSDCSAATTKGTAFVELELSSQFKTRYAVSIMLIVALPISSVRTAISSCRWISTQG